MKKYGILLMVVFLISASCNLQIEKRRYMKGYHVTMHSVKNHKSPQGKKEEAPAPESVSVKTTVPLQPEVVSFQGTSFQIIPSREQQVVSPVRNTKANVIPANSITAEIKTFKSKTTLTRDTNPIQGKSSSSSLFILLATLFASVSTLLFRPFISRSKPAGYWAVNNRKLVRAIFLPANMILAGLGYLVGVNLDKSGVTSPDMFLYSVTAFSAALILFHPARKARTGIFRNSFVRQKWFSMLLLLSGMMLFVHLGNHHRETNAINGRINRLEQIIVSPTIISHDTPPSGQPQKGMDDGSRIALSVLLVLACIVAILFLAALSCSLSCSGQDSLAALVLIFGVPLAVVLTVAGMRALLHPIKVRKQAERQGIKQS